VKAGTIFDNILITDDIEVAKTQQENIFKNIVSYNFYEIIENYF